MRIGILTFWETEDNYGQLLQCYATQKYLQSLGHDTFLLRATNGHEYHYTLKAQIFDKLRTAYRLRVYPVYFTKRLLSSAWYTVCHGKLRKRIINRGFEQFRQKHLNCTEVYTLQMLQQNPPQADAFVVGSDQIWNTTDGIYFLSWAKDSTLKLSMAASFGARNQSTDFCNLIRPWLKRFALITVREKSGIEFCRAAGRNDALQVPDPTLLLRADDYLQLASGSIPDTPYVFIYFLGTRTCIDWNEIQRFAKAKGLKIIYVGSQGQVDKFKKIEPTIESWLSLMANAEYVITNSFHGTVFALQFHKKFIVYPVAGFVAKMNDRLTSLLTPLGLDNHIYNGTLKYIDKSIDYSEVFTRLDKDSTECKFLFNDVLRGGKCTCS